MRHRVQSIQVNSPSHPLAEVAVGMGVAELSLSAAGLRPSIAEPTSETHQTRVHFTSTVGVRTVIALAVDAGTGCGHTGEVTSS